MSSEQQLRWARWGAVLLCLTTTLVALTSDEPLPGLSGWLPRPLLALIAFGYAALLFHLLRLAPGPPRERSLAALMLCSLPIDFDFLSAFNLFALPFVIPGRRRRWIGAQAGIFFVQLLFGWLGLGKPGQWTNIQAVLAASPAELALALGAGLLQCAAWGGFAYLVGSLLVQLDRDRGQLAHTNASLRGAQVMLAETARLEERLKISRELHDSVGHYLTSLGLQLEIAGNVAGPEAQRPVERARLLVRLLLAEVREAASDWRVERPEALPVAIRELCASAPGLKVELTLADDLPPASPGTSHALYRIVQEALTNTLRHGGARTFTVDLRTGTGGGFELTVRDDGAGAGQFEKGNGVRGIEDRVRELSGTMQISTSPGKGFTLQVSIPPARSVAA
jgi:signal transduction histidine kinase